MLFFGGWQPPFPTDFTGAWPPTCDQPVRLRAGSSLKIVFCFFMFAMVKAIVPRYRYDQLMRLGWKVFLPTSLVAVVAGAPGASVAHRPAAGCWAPRRRRGQG